MDFFNPQSGNVITADNLPRFWAKWNMLREPHYEIYELKEVNEAADRVVLMSRRTRTLVYPSLSVLLNQDYNWKPFVFDGGKK